VRNAFSMMNERRGRREVLAASISNALHAHRERTGETAKALCERLGLGMSGYAWLRKVASKGATHIRGKRRADWDKVCLAIGTDPTWILEGYDPRNSVGFPIAKVLAVGLVELHTRAGTKPHEWDVRSLVDSLVGNLAEQVSWHIQEETKKGNRQ
jgi:hypothetical protein